MYLSVICRNQFGNHLAGASRASTVKGNVSAAALAHEAPGGIKTVSEAKLVAGITKIAVPALPEINVLHKHL